MQIIPVIDLKHGRVVRGIAGEREKYRPIKSILASDARPATVAKAFVDLGLAEIYVADLDAIAGEEPAWDAYQQMAQCGARLILDAGLGDSSRAAAMAQFSSAEFSSAEFSNTGFSNFGNRLSGIVVGLESLRGADALTAIAETIDAEQLIFSLDLKDGQPLTDVEAWRAQDPMAIADMVLAAGIRRLIVLDLRRVGVGQGVGTEGLCRRLADRHPSVEIIAGGGVRNLVDLQSLATTGCSAALIASALHDGRIGATEIRAAGDILN